MLLNVRAQPTGSNILHIADDVRTQLVAVRDVLPADVGLSFFYDQSAFVRESVASVWESILVGLLFAVVILCIFLNNRGSVLTAIVVIPVSVLVTVVAMFAMQMTFNLMTLGGIAAAIGLIIDDAIVVVEAMDTHLAEGHSRIAAIRGAMDEIIHPLVCSTLTPVVVFIPLAFLDGLPGVFFRALALTMVVALLTSLVLAVSLTPTLASLWIRGRTQTESTADSSAGFLLRLVLGVFDKGLRLALRLRWLTLLACIAVGLAGAQVYGHLASDFLPAMDEGGFVIDYIAPWGTSLEETDRNLQVAEAILRETPEVDGYSRRTGARLALAIAEPNTGDLLVKLRRERARSTDEVKAYLRRRFNEALSGIEWSFPGILGALIGDLTSSPDPIEVKLFSADTEWLEQQAPKVRAVIDAVPGVIDTFDGLVTAGPTLSFVVRPEAARRLGLSVEDVAATVHTAMLGRTASRRSSTWRNRAGSSSCGARTCANSWR